jgi:hypothetical protein
MEYGDYQLGNPGTISSSLYTAIYFRPCNDNLVHQPLRNSCSASANAACVFVLPPG